MIVRSDTPFSVCTKKGRRGYRFGRRCRLSPLTLIVRIRGDRGLRLVRVLVHLSCLTGLTAGQRAAMHVMAGYVRRKFQ